MGEVGGGGRTTLPNAATPVKRLLNAGWVQWVEEEAETCETIFVKVAIGDYV